MPCSLNGRRIMKYRIDVEVKGYMTIEVEAESMAEAEDKAGVVFAERHFKDPIGHLRYKSTCCSGLEDE